MRIHGGCYAQRGLARTRHTCVYSVGVWSLGSPSFPIAVTCSVYVNGSGHCCAQAFGYLIHFLDIHIVWFWFWHVNTCIHTMHDAHILHTRYLKGDVLFWLKFHFWGIGRVGQYPTYTVYIRYFWQENHQIYSHIRCIYTVLANPRYRACASAVGSVGVAYLPA